MLSAGKVKKLSLYFLAVVGICVFGAVVPSHAASLGTGERVYVGGMPFGMKINIDGAVVMGTDEVDGAGRSPAAEAGLRRGDIITGVGGYGVSSIRELTNALDACGDTADVTFIRGGKEKKTVVRPENDDSGKRKIGVVVRDSAAGIGTVTFIEPDTRFFAGLGHGVCDADSGAVLPIRYGSVEDVEITGINRGKAGAPGELRGAFTGRRIGKVTKNELTGVYGVLSDMPEFSGEPYEIADASEVENGTAYIRSCVSGTPELYEIRISKLSGGGEKNFSVKVTDERLLELSGGIVQGMSGSPIIQNGKLIGAVTHVLVGDPTEGYGIFIGNMTDAVISEIYEDSAA